MNYWNETPLFRFLILFICGILLAVYFPWFSLKAMLPLCCSLILLFISKYIFRRRRDQYRRRWISGVLSYPAVFFAGYVLTGLHTEKLYPRHFRNFQHAETYIGYLTEPIIEKSRSYKTVMKLLYVKNGNAWEPSAGNCLVYFFTDSTSASLNYGDLIVFCSKPAEVLPAANPSQFDYRRWLGFNKIYDQVFLREGEWKLLDHQSGFMLPELSYSLRDKLLSVFSENHITGQDYAVLSALILGFEDDIGQETMNAYAASGALHILSVSGLHVGIIYIAINFFLSFLNYNRRSRLLKSLIIILFLWFYALLTGLSPSVLRSATMLSFIVIGQMTRQHTNLYNTLAASAFFLLGLNPFLIMQVGFQLSYLAVLGIIFLQPAIQQLMDPPGWIFRQVWSIVSVSLAAQVATFPLALLYFHQFPVYFLIANLIVIPISTLIIYGGIFLFTISWWHSAAEVAGVLLGYVVQSMNAIVIYIEGLPYSLLSGISITVFETWVIYIFICTLLCFLVFRLKRFVVLAMVAIVFILASQIKESLNIRKQKQLVVYSMKGHAVLNIIDGKKNLMLADSATFCNKSIMSFNIYQHWWECGLDENEVNVLSDSAVDHNNNFLYKNFIRYGHLSVIRVTEPVMFGRRMRKTEADFVILSQNVRTNLKNINEQFKFRYLIIDSSNSLSRAARWMEEANQLGIHAHSVLHQGAFVYNFAGHGEVYR